MTAELRHQSRSIQFGGHRPPLQNSITSARRGRRRRGQELRVARLVEIRGADHLGAWGSGSLIVTRMQHIAANRVVLGKALGNRDRRADMDQLKELTEAFSMDCVCSRGTGE